MRILLVTPMPPDRSAPGAIPAVLHAQLQGLAARHEVAVLTVAGPDPRELAAVDALAAAGFEVHAARRRAPRGAPGGPDLRRQALRWARTDQPYRTVAFWAPGLQAVLDRLAAQRRFDVLAVEDSAMGAYRVPPTLPSAFTEHEVRGARPDAPAPRTPRELPTWLGTQVNWHRWATYQPRVWAAFDVVQAFTARDAAAIRAALTAADPPPVLVNPFAIDLPPLLPTQPDPDLAVFLGNYTHAPNVDAALFLAREVFPRLRERRPGTRLALAGVHPPAEVQALAAEPGIDVLGRVEDADALVRRAAVVLAPVRTGGGMRMKTLHAMALGRPLVTTPLGVEGLAADGRVPPVAIGADAPQLAAAAAELLDDADAAARLGARAREFVQAHHSPRAYAERLTATYALAIDRHAARSPGARADRC